MVADGADSEEYALFLLYNPGLGNEEFSVVPNPADKIPQFSTLSNVIIAAGDWHQIHFTCLEKLEKT